MAHPPSCKREQSPPGNRPNMSDLRIVLLGTSIAENHRVVNLILNKEAFERKASSSGVQEFSERVEGRNITVISTSHLLNPELKLQAITQKVSALSPPEPHVIILVLQHRDFSKEQRDRLPSVLNCFGEQAMKRTLILTTDDEPDHAGLRSAQQNELIQEISTECGGGHLQLHNTHSQLLEKINEIIICSFKETQQVSSVDPDDRFMDSVRPICDLRIVLLGKNASENSRVRNIILGIDLHESAPYTSLQKHNVLKISGQVENRHIMVINTLHLLNPDTSNDQITQTVRECAEISDPGPHAFILVLQYKDFTAENMRRVKYVLNTFNEEASKRTIIVTTDEETYGTHTPSHVKINAVMHEFGGGHLQLEEKRPEWPSEVFKRVDQMCKEDQEEYLTCEIYHDVKGRAVDEEQSGFLDLSRSEGECKENTLYKDNENPNQSKRSEISPIDVREWTRSNKNISRKQKLNLVLCGSDGALKVSVSRLLRGKKISTSHQRVSSEDFFKKEEKIHGRLVSLLELPALSHLSEDEVMGQTLHCVSLCHPGVHAFLLIIPDGPLTDKDKAEMEKIQKTFYSEKHLIVVFISHSSVNKRVTDLIKSSTEYQKFISGCGGQYCNIGFKEFEDSIQELLEYIENMKTGSYSLRMHVEALRNRTICETEEKCEEKCKRMENKIKELQQKLQSVGADCDADDHECLRIVLIGRTGSGKSATGNTILGRNEFNSRMSTNSVTTVCEKGVGEVDGRSVAVVDTPGLFDTTLTNEQAVEEIMKCVSLSAPGPHVFVIVLSLGRFTKEETDTIDLIKKIFGLKAAQFSMVLFTRGDDLGNQSIEDYVNESKSGELQKLIRDCGNRFLVFNNREKQDKTQVMKLLKMIEEVKSNNQGRFFTNDMFEEAEMSIKKKMEEIMKAKEREIQKQKEELQAKYEMEIKNMMKRLEEEKQRAEEERRKMEKQLKEKEEKLIKEFEEKEKTDQKQREIENQKRLEEEKQQRAEYDQRIEEMKREIDNQRSQYEQQQKEREEEDRRREEKYRQDQEKMRNEQERIIEELKRKEEETKKRDLEEKRRNEEEEEERQRWKRKIKEAENERKEIQEEIKRQQREWEDEKKRQMKEREEERERKEKHEDQLREKQEELEKMRKRFEGEREEERQKMEEERLKQRREREEKERDYEEQRQETKRHYERLERERKEEWERRKHEDEERREDERKRWKKMIEDLKSEQKEEKGRREAEEKERQKREEKKRDEMKQKYQEEMDDMKKKHVVEARKQAEEFNDFREKKEKHLQELLQILDERQKQQELLEKLYQLLQLKKWYQLFLNKDVEAFHTRLEVAKVDELNKLQEEVKELLEEQRKKKTCVFL